jgi:glycosyltransferase involved in cell wall biosynthesis
VRVLFLTIAKPERGSGDGITDYTYQLKRSIGKRAQVDVIYSIGRMKRNDAVGLISTSLLFGRKVDKAIKRGYDIVHITNHEIGLLAGRIKSRDKSVKVVTTIHDLMRFRNGMNEGILQKVYNINTVKNVTSAVKNSDFLLFNSSQTQNDVNKTFPRLNRLRQKVIPHGIDEAFMRPITKRKRNRKFIVGYLGSLAYHKNAIMVLKTAKAFNGYNDFKFLVYGTGSTSNILAKYKDVNGLDNVSLMGFAPQDKIVNIYDSFDAFIFPSLYEGLGLPILEAQARGLPVIICKKAQITKEVRRYCFEAESEVNVVEIIKRIKDRWYSSRLKNNAILYARTFNWKRTASETLGVYKRL